MHTEENIFFDGCLGSATIKATISFFHLARKIEKDYLLFQNEKRLSDKRNIYVHFASGSYASEYIVKKQLFFQKRLRLYITEEGFYQLLCFKEDATSPLWNLRINSEYSCFEYSIIADEIEIIDLSCLVFNRFLLQHTFINHNGLIIHAAGGSIYGKGIVFPAVSGTGKSTLSHLLLPFPDNQLYSEERIIMRKMNDGWQLWGTPWKGTGVIARNESARLSALVFLSQAPQTKISELAPFAALRRLLETVSIPWYSQEWTDKGLAVCESLLRDIPAFELAFRPDQTAVQAVADLAASLP